MTEMNLRPTLSDGEILVRPLRRDDWDSLHAAASDPLVWAGHPASDRWQEPVFRQFFDEALASGGALVVARVATGEIVGSSRYDRSRADDGEIEIGWTFLARSEWGGATNLRVKRLMIGHALDHYRRVIFLIGGTNLRSQRAMAKIGGISTGRVHQARLNGMPVTHLIYAIDRDAFDGGPLGAVPTASVPTREKAIE